MALFLKGYLHHVHWNEVFCSIGPDAENPPISQWVSVTTLPKSSIQWWLEEVPPSDSLKTHFQSAKIHLLTGSW